MMTTGDRQVAARLRGQLAAVGARYRGARIPPQLRAELIAHARARRAAGASMRTIAVALGVAPESIRRWTRVPAARSTALVPVQVVPEHSVARAAPLTLVSPRGFRVEGLGLAEVGALLGALE
jgi:hypothetical protein